MDSLALLLSRVSGKSRAKFLNLPLPHAVPPTVPLFSTWATTSKDLAIQSLAWHSQMFHLFPVFFWFGAIKILISAKNVQFATSPHSQKTKSRFNTNSHNHNRIFFRVSDDNLNLSSSYDGFILVRTVQIGWRSWQRGSLLMARCRTIPLPQQSPICYTRRDTYVSEGEGASIMIT